MPPLNFHDRQHIARMFIQEQRVNAIFNRFIRNIAPEMRKWKEYNSNSVWVRNSAIETAVNRHLVELQSLLVKEITTNQKNAWKSANLKNDEIVERYIKGMALSSVAKEGMFSRNIDALTALQNRVDNGMNLSQRVWKITEQAKGNVELFLESGVATGRSAEEIGRDFRQVLQNPDKVFRRVRDKNGKLVPSAPMKAYNPGQGVYRSSRMNALRVSATETNMGYRVSDCERWRQLDFVLGFEVKRSPNAKPCKICDALVGKYPKDFIFSAFHPFCICFAVPLLMNHDDFADYLLDDTIPADKYVQNIPANAQKFLEFNPGYKNNSYFTKLNVPFFNGKRGGIEDIVTKLRQSKRPTDNKMFVAFEPFSPIIIQYLSNMKAERERQKLLKSVLEDDNFKLLSKNDVTGAKTVMHPLHKGTSAHRWKETKQMAAELNARGVNVGFLPEYVNESCADAITQFKGRYVIADFKYSNTQKIGTLKKDLMKGFGQSDYIVLKLDKGNTDLFLQAIDELARKDISVKNIVLINKYGKTIEIERRDIISGRYKQKIRGKL